MIILRDFLQLFKSEDMYLDLYINGESSLYARLTDAIKILNSDIRGELLVTKQSVSIYETYIGFAEIYKKELKVYCTEGV